MYIQVSENAMEQWVRVQNEWNRQVLVWLRQRVGEIAIVAVAQACTRGDSKPYLSTVCRHLDLSVPRFAAHGGSSGGVGERHLAAMSEILRVPSPRAQASQ
jgi:hypothetical protein